MIVCPWKDLGRYAPIIPGLEEAMKVVAELDDLTPRTIPLSDGSALNLSTGKYYTPKGNNLSEIGGLTPDVPIAVTDEMAALIYAQLLPVEEDIQIQAAIGVLQEKLQQNP